MSNSDEIRGEQEFIDRLYERVDALRGDTEAGVTAALGQGNTPMQARLERDILVAERSGLLAALNAAVCDRFGIAHTTIQIEEPALAERPVHA